MGYGPVGASLHWGTVWAVFGQEAATSQHGPETPVRLTWHHGGLALPMLRLDLIPITIRKEL